jgi:hypothetical protein
VTLHARGSDHTGAYTGLHLDRYLAAAVTGGLPPFAIAIAIVDGGESSYWHPRQGTDPAGMVIHEFVPLLARHGLITGHLAAAGRARPARSTMPRIGAGTMSGRIWRRYAASP